MELSPVSTNDHTEVKRPISSRFPTSTGLQVDSDCKGDNHTSTTDLLKGDNSDNPEMHTDYTMNVCSTGIEPVIVEDYDCDHIIPSLQPAQCIPSTLCTPSSALQTESDDDMLGSLLLEDNSNKSEQINKLIQLSKDLTKDSFVNHVLLDFEQSEAKLDSTRSELLNLLKLDSRFPFEPDCEVKRRMNSITRHGESACVKMAYDIHTLILALEGANMHSLKDVISNTRKQSRPSSVSRQTSRQDSHQDKCACKLELNVLKENYTGLQADILLIKQRQAAVENQQKLDIDNVKKTLQDSVNDILQKTAFIESTAQTKMLQCDKTVTFNTKVILELQHSAANLKKSLDLINFKLQNKDAGQQPNQLCPENNQLTSNCRENAPVYPLKKDAGVQCEILMPTKNIHQIELQFDQASATEETMLIPGGNLIDLDKNGESQINTNSQQVLSNKCLLISDDEKNNAESDFSFGNSKIPTIVSKNRSSNSKKQSNKKKDRNINFATIRKEVAAAKQNNRRDNSRPNAFSYEKQSSGNDDFESYVRKRTKRFYVGGFLPSITEQKIATYVNDQGLTVTKVTIFRKKRNTRTIVTIRVNVEDDGNADTMVDDPYFWPKGVICHPWLSQNALRQQRAGTSDTHYQHGYNEQHISYQDGENYTNDIYYNRYNVLEDECCSID